MLRAATLCKPVEFKHAGLRARTCKVGNAGDFMLFDDGLIVVFTMEDPRLAFLEDGEYCTRLELLELIDAYGD